MKAWDRRTGANSASEISGCRPLQPPSHSWGRYWGKNPKRPRKTRFTAALHTVWNFTPQPADVVEINHRACLRWHLPTSGCFLRTRIFMVSDILIAMPNPVSQTKFQTEAKVRKPGKYRLDAMDSNRVAKNLVLFHPDESDVARLMTQASWSIPGLAAVEDVMAVMRHNPDCVFGVARPLPVQRRCSGRRRFPSPCCRSVGWAWSFWPWTR